MKQSELLEKSKGLYYYVNKRKKAGTSRKKGHPKAPSKQDWENAAKTAKESTNEGLAELAGVAERDHEVQMARADLYKIAKYAIKLHEMLKGVSETEGMQGWQQSKITKAADYMGSVYHAMDYENKFEGVNEAKEKMCPEACCGKPVSECSCGPDCPHCDCYTENKTAKGKKLMAGAGTTSAEVNAAASAQQSSWKASPSFTSEGKSPHKKGSKKYKKHMAAKHASMAEDYKAHIQKRLNEALADIAETASLCPECGNPSYTTLPEEKQKGVDGKVCWKGYKRMGTKKKGGKTVDNCVKM
jgi:hypothetical protein